MNIFYKFIAVAVVFGVAACGKQEKQEVAKERAEANALFFIQRSERRGGDLHS